MGNSKRWAGLKRDLTLAVLPTVTILLVLAGMEFWLKQHLLFASLASSAFGIYLASHHKNNGVKVLIGTQLGGAIAGFCAQSIGGPGYFAAAGAMILVIALMVALACRASARRFDGALLCFCAGCVQKRDAVRGGRGAGGTFGGVAKKGGRSMDA